MTAWINGWAAAARASALVAVWLALALAAAHPAHADDRARVVLSPEAGFGRLILKFQGRTDLPRHRVRVDNNILAVTFDAPVDITAMPDVVSGLSDYVTIARVDGDGRGLRLGMRPLVQVNSTEAGEQLFIDLLPPGWNGPAPALPPAVIAELERRAALDRASAEARRRAEEAERMKPQVALRVGRNPTFYRVEFQWSEDTEGAFEAQSGQGTVSFDWPVAVDLQPVLSTMPPELLSVANEVTTGSTRLSLKFVEGVEPRFYSEGPRSFTLDIDTGAFAGTRLPIAVENVAAHEPAHAVADAGETPPESHAEMTHEVQTHIVPQVTTEGSTVRIAFPFDEEVPAAAFRRGNTLWLIFDTPVSVGELDASSAFDRVASGFSAMRSGETQTVRIDLSTERLSTLNSEGQSWVVSIGDLPLNPTAPVSLDRRRDKDGRFEIVADLKRPNRVHTFEDPDVGDRLDVVTALPPAIGLTRDLTHVDFDALRSIHGLVVRPKREDIQVDLAGSLVQVRAPDGLRLSATTSPPLDLEVAQAVRKFYVDLNSLQLTDLSGFVTQQDAILQRTTTAEGRDRDVARLELADFYIANRLAFEALGVIEVLEAELKSEDLKGRLRLARAIADVVAERPAEALTILNSPAFAEQVDSLVWRTIARADALDWAGARADAMAAVTVIESYPAWVQARFLFAGTRAAIESGDPNQAERYLSMLPHSTLSTDEMSLYTLLTGRAQEAAGQDTQALDTYGQVIAADRRPTRAEAVYRTLQVLDRQGRLDVKKAVTTLGSEVLMWRGGPLEAEMQALLADLNFRSGAYRDGFATVKDAVMYHPDSAPTLALLAKAGEQFASLYLDGRADELDPIEALSLYYDYRQFTPPGARGDEMIRNLARRLVKLDLLQQAGDLLDYQVTNRLKGAAQAQVGADLAVIRLADRQPDAALRALGSSQIADLPPSLERRRRVLEARAMIDAGRHDLALDMLSRLEGRDVTLLQADAQWAAKRYVQASELLEAAQEPLLADGKLAHSARKQVIKAAVGYVLAGDKVGPSRLRAKFSVAMSQTPEWALFDFVTAETTQISPEFRRVTREAAGLDLLDSFLAAYRQEYGGDAAPLKAKPGPDDV